MCNSRFSLSEWIGSGKIFEAEITLPDTASCVLQLPSGDTVPVTSGKYRYVLD